MAMCNAHLVKQRSCKNVHPDCIIGIIRIPNVHTNSWVGGMACVHFVHACLLFGWSTFLGNKLFRSPPLIWITRSENALFPLWNGSMECSPCSVPIPHMISSAPTCDNCLSACLLLLKSPFHNFHLRIICLVSALDLIVSLKKRF